MYKVNNQQFNSYMAAVAAARAVGAEVFEVREDGSHIRRWTPAAPVSAKRTACITSTSPHTTRNKKHAKTTRPAAAPGTT
jgi:hypothetical protein